MQARRLQVNGNVNHNPNEDEQPKEVGPHIHRLVVYHEERASTVPVRMEEHSIACLEMWIINEEVFEVRVVNVSDVGFVLCFFLVILFLFTL